MNIPVRKLRIFGFIILLMIFSIGVSIDFLLPPVLISQSEKAINDNNTNEIKEVLSQFEVFTKISPYLKVVFDLYLANAEFMNLQNNWTKNPPRDLYIAMQSTKAKIIKARNSLPEILIFGSRKENLNKIVANSLTRIVTFEMQNMEGQRKQELKESLDYQIKAGQKGFVGFGEVVNNLEKNK